MPDDLPICLAGEDLLASADRALFWPAAHTLFVADVHFGKDATFRHAGRWIPPGTTSDDLARLSALISRYHARRLIILGDAFHSEHSGDPATLEPIRQWRDATPADVLMIRGNHDRRTDNLAAYVNFTMLEEGHALPPWSLHHHPVDSSPGYSLCGHLHPVARAYGSARESLRLPCFWATSRQCVLPAFGGFTGGSTVRPAQGDRLLLIVGDRLLDADQCGSGAPA